MCCDIRGGTDNDANYLNTMSEYIEPNDLKLADLGYYKAGYLKEIDNKNIHKDIKHIITFFISYLPL